MPGGRLLFRIEEINAKVLKKIAFANTTEIGMKFVVDLDIDVYSLMIQ